MREAPEREQQGERLGECDELAIGEVVEELLRARQLDTTNMESVNRGYAMLSDEMDKLFYDVKTPCNVCNFHRITPKLTQIAAIALRMKSDLLLLAVAYDPVANAKLRLERFMAQEQREAERNRGRACGGKGQEGEVTDGG